MMTRISLLRLLTCALPAVGVFATAPLLLAPWTGNCSACMVSPGDNGDLLLNLHFSLPADQYLHQVSLEFNTSTGTNLLSQDITQVIHAVGVPVVRDLARRGSFNVVPPHASPASAMHGDFVLERTLSNLTIPAGATAVDMRFKICAEPYSSNSSAGMRCTTRVERLLMMPAPAAIKSQPGELAPNNFKIENAG